MYSKILVFWTLHLERKKKKEEKNIRTLYCSVVCWICCFVEIHLTSPSSICTTLRSMFLGASENLWLAPRLVSMYAQVLVWRILILQIICMKSVNWPKTQGILFPRMDNIIWSMKNCYISCRKYNRYFSSLFFLSIFLSNLLKPFASAFFIL